MKKIQLYVTCLFALALLVVPYRAFAFIGLDAGVGYWQQTPSGTLSYHPGTSASASNSLDLKDDLNYDGKNQAFVRIKAELPLILPNIYAMYTPMSFDGTGKKNVDFKYGDITFKGNIPFQSKIKLDHYDVALFYPIPLLKTATAGVLNIELGLNAKIVSFEGQVTGTDSITGTTKTASVSQTLPIPMAYVGVQVKPISLISIEAEARGIAYSDSHFYDFSGRIKIMPIGPLYIAGGYRSEQIKISSSLVTDVDADIKFSGPFVEAGLSF